MANYESVWAKCVSVFPILGHQNINTGADCNADLHAIVAELSRMEIAESVYESVRLEIDAQLRQQIVPKFWQYFAPIPPPAAPNNTPKHVLAANERDFLRFQTAVHELHGTFDALRCLAKRLTLFREMCRFQRPLQRYAGQPETCQLIDLLRVVLLSQLPANYQDVVLAFYGKSFRVFLSSQDKETAMDAANTSGTTVTSTSSTCGECTGCDAPHERCRCAELVRTFGDTNRWLLDMQLLDRLAGVTLTGLIQQEIRLYVRRTTHAIFDVTHLKRLEGWLDAIVLNWLQRIYSSSVDNIAAPAGQLLDEVLNSFRVKLNSFMYEVYAGELIEQFFNIIIDFPDSQPVIDDMRHIFQRLDCRAEFVRSVKHALQSRLLHPGVNTNDILTGYVAAIKAIRHLDSSGVLLETITEPVKQYMRGRSDTVRCVVTALTEEGPADLAEELAKSEIMAEAPAKQRLEEQTNWASWQPDPVHVYPKKQASGSSSSSRCADIISMVVDIYGSKELFVGEYRNLLADRLLTQLDFSPEKEIRNLELLKLRFGETVLHNCEVMLKDISDSKRIDAHIHGDGEYTMDGMPFTISSLILSSQFWPTFKTETIELPATLAAEFERYTKSYESYKGNRTLIWRPAIGRVDIEIELGDRLIEMAVSPSQAAILTLFQERESWTLAELSSTLKLPGSLVRKRIALWQTHGIIRELCAGDNGGGGDIVFVLVQDGSGDLLMAGDERLLAGGVGGVGSTAPDECDDDEAESAMASASEQREEDLQVFWSYIVGMLTNLDSMPLERIHQMLKMFASHGPGVEFTPEELKNFLQRKVREHKLIFVGGVYHLPK